MSHGRATRDPSPVGLAQLFDGSSLVGLTDGEVLARFVATRDESAFEGLVVRLGPMVLGVCRRMLSDRADADDAFQATFLVLVRRAGAVDRGELIGPWLHGVAVRVCRRARGRGARRRLVEQTGVEVDALPPSSSPLAESTQLDQAETRATIDSEIARLPETYRRLVILCDVEGLTRSEAADRLGWTPNMVRGRLARARTRLRAGLTHRGCTPPGLAPSTIEASGLAILPWMCSPPPTLIVITARAAMATLFPSGRTVVATLASTSALSLAEGVIRAMFVTSWKFVGAGLIAAGTLAAGTAGVLNAQGPGPANPPVAQKPADDIKLIPASVPPADASLKVLLEERLRSAQVRYEAQNTFYEEGRITIDRLITASRRVMDAEIALADTSEKRRASIQTYVDRLQRIHDRETKELEVGRATTADIAEASDSLVEARILLAQQAGERPFEAGVTAGPSSTPKASQVGTNKASKALASFNQARVEVARKLFAEAERLFPTELSPLEYVNAQQILSKAELAAATTSEARAAACQSLIKQMRSAIAATEGLVRRGERKPTDVMNLQIALLELQAHAAGGDTADPQVIGDLDRRLTDLEQKVDRILDLLSTIPGRR